MFTASFCNDAVKASILADQGSDACIMPPDLFAQILQAEPSLKTKLLDTPIRYETVDKSAASLSCRKTIIMDVLLRIRHGTNLALRNIEWVVSDQPVSHAIISRHVLRSLGLDNRVLLAAACDRFHGEVDVTALLNAQAKVDEKNYGSVCSVALSAVQNMEVRSIPPQQETMIPKMMQIYT